MRLIPNILVLPYRNPFVVAKAAATLDVLSGGRFTLAVATGYMRGEYKALGVDFEQRNALFDEAIEVIRGVWSEDEFAYEGSTFSAKGQTANPKPNATPARSGSAGTAASPAGVWPATATAGVPFPPPGSWPARPRRRRSRRVDDLRPMLDELWQFMEEAGRDPASIDVAFGSGAGGRPGRRRLQPRGPAGRPRTNWRRSASPGRAPACPAIRWPTPSRPSSASARPSSTDPRQPRAGAQPIPALEARRALY